MSPTGKVGDSSGVQRLVTLANELTKETGPVRKALLGQTLEALKTGGVGARIPMIQRAVEASKQATGQALTDTTGSLASAGLGRTPYAASTTAEVRTAGGLAASQIPTSMAQQVIGSYPGLASQVTQPLLQATGMEIGASEFDANQQARFLSDLGSALEFGMGAKGGGGATPSAPVTAGGTSSGATYPDASGVSSTGVAWDQIKALFGSGQSPSTFGY